MILMQTCPKHKLARERCHWPTGNNVAYVTKSFMMAKSYILGVITNSHLLCEFLDVNMHSH